LRIFGDQYPTPDGTPVRDYIHVADLGQAHILALEHLRREGKSEFVNLGTGRGYSVLEVVAAVRRVTGRPIETRVEAPRPGDAPFLVACADKARQLLGWEPAFADLEEIVATAWQWHRAHPGGYRL
jgi:UDP-glucose 4-epimerase